MDAAWWLKHGTEASKRFHGDLVTLAPDAGQYGAAVVEQPPEGFGNSGAMAARLALDWGAHRVLLLGFDCQHTGGKTHWHGSHPKGLGDAASVPLWFAHFDAVAKAASGRVINCTRETALTCFERASLELALRG
jgi:hypothetical protein